MGMVRGTSGMGTSHGTRGSIEVCVAEHTATYVCRPHRIPYVDRITMHSTLGMGWEHLIESRREYQDTSGALDMVPGVSRGARSVAQTAMASAVAIKRYIGCGGVIAVIRAVRV